LKNKLILAEAVLACSITAFTQAMPVRADTQNSFESAVSSFFAGSLSDADALAKAESMTDDTSALSALGGRAQNAADALSAFETAKAAYFTGQGTAPAAAADAWNTELAYLTAYLGSGTVTEVIPRYEVTGCEDNGSTVTIHVSEWLMAGYTEAGSSAVNATGCLYSFDVTMNTDGWQASAVTNVTESTDTEQASEMAASSSVSDETGTNDGLVGSAAYSYDASKAVAYADQWALSYNRASYPVYSGVDCANFASQCMYAGGLAQDGTWRPGSSAWINCQSQMNYLARLASLVAADDSNVRTGDPVYYDWNRDGHYDHAAICVGTNASGTPVVDAHTQPRYHVPWTMTSTSIKKTVLLVPQETPAPVPTTPTGSTTVLNGTDYSAVYDFNYYIAKYPDIKAAYGSNPTGALQHFVTFGMKEGRQASAAFNVSVYKGNYPDLDKVFGTDLVKYYLHYVQYGQKEGRNATAKISSSSSVSTTGTTVLNGVNYAAVYDFNYYINKYPDIKAAYGSNPAGALQHFVEYGMNEGRQGSASFYVWYYRGNYADLILSYGDDLKPYYIHYVNFGQKEGRVATRKIASNVMFYDGVDYANVYDFCYYTKRYPDIMKAYGRDPAGAIRHFILYGIKEGRQAESSFNVISYQNNYPDLRAAFGTSKDDLMKYVVHYLTYGKAEHRSGL